MGCKRVFLLVGIFLIIVNITHAQRSKRVVIDSTQIHSLRVFTQSLNQAYADSLADTTIILKTNKLFNTISDYNLRRQVLFVRNFAKANNFQTDINELKKYIEYLEKQRFLCDSLRQELCTKLATFNTSDSLAMADSALYIANVTSKDSVLMAKNELYNRYAKIDTLVAAVHTAISGFESDSVISFINDIRRDTVYFYFIDINSDSVEVKLYRQNTDLVRLNLTDYWGTKVPAVIRDITQNSMRLLIDNTPEIENENGDRAKEAVGRLKRYDYRNPKITIEKRKMPGPATFWSLYGDASFELSQNGQTNWVKGGEPSMSFIASVNLFANYKKNNTSWENSVKFKIGMLRQGEYSDTNAHWVFNEDRIELASKYGRKLNNGYYLSVIGEFKTQSAPNYSYVNNIRQAVPVSKFMNPAYLTFAVGFDLKQYKGLKVFLSPVTGKATYVLNSDINRAKYGVDTSKNALYEVGVLSQIKHKTTVFGNITIENELDLFLNYVKKPQFKTVDVDWEMKIIFPVNDYVKAKFSSQLIWDNDINIPDPTPDNAQNTKKGIQFKEIISLGFVYKF